jgi:hypothetical protein
MGVYIDYSFYAECPERELLARLRQLRQKATSLPLARVGRIKRLDPVYQGMPLQLLREQGYALPAAVKARLKGKSSREYRLQCGLAAPVVSMLVPQKLERRFMKPAIEFVKTTDLWNEADLPEEVQCGSITIFRRGFAFALARFDPPRPTKAYPVQMAKCHVWQPDRLLPGNTGFLTWPWSIWQCEVAAEERRIRRRRAHTENCQTAPLVGHL